MPLFGKKKRSAVGLDIGHSTVKGIELSGTPGALVVDRFGSTTVDEPIDSAKRGEAIVRAVQRLFAEAGFTTKRVVAAVNGESVIVRVIRLPYFSDKEKEQLDFAVRAEAQDFIPFDIEDVAFDYQRLGVVEEGPEGKALEVLIVAAQKDLVHWHTEVLRAAGLDPRIMDVGSFALVNAVHHGAQMTPSRPVALVDIGSSLTNIAIMKGETTRFTRDLSTAGNTITRAIMNELRCDEEKAESAKAEFGISLENGKESEEEILTISQSNLTEMMEDINAGDSGAASTAADQQVNAICEQFLGEIVSEIKRCLLFYENQLDGEAVDRIFLTGRTVQMKNADRYIAGLLDVPVEILDPFKGVSGRIASLDPITRGATYSVSLGLALRSVIGGGVQ
jgi:type IV pilus assembly protein PilM